MIFGECPAFGTRQIKLKNKKQLKLCRVPELRHSANIFFKKNISLPSVALGKEYKKIAVTLTDGVKYFPRAWAAPGKYFAEWTGFSTQQTKALPSSDLTEPPCRVLHSAKALPSAKQPLPSAADTRQSGDLL
jgi:hypothetical protein